MDSAVRRHTKAGICAATTAAVVVSPLLASAPASVKLPALPSVSTAAVQLTAAYNPLQPWQDAFKTAAANAGRIGDAVSEAPAVLLQQFLANQINHVGAVLQNPGNIGAVLGEIGHNVQSAITAATLLGTDPGNNSQSVDSNDGFHFILLQVIPKLLPTASNAMANRVVQEVFNFLASPLSGVLIGLAGPAISPAVALANSLTSIGASLSQGDAAKALQTAINIPAAMVNGFLNGANLNLDLVAQVINKTIPLSDNAVVKALNIQFGGLFTAGSTGWDQMGLGGSILNSLGQTVYADIIGTDLQIDGLGIGPIGAMVSLGRILAKAIGWSGTGNPLAPKAAVEPAAATTQVSVTKAATDNSITSIPQPALAVTPAKATSVQAPDTAAKPEAPAKSETPATPATPATSETPATPATPATPSKSDDTKPDTTKSETTKSDTTKSDTTKSDTTKSETKKSESKKPGKQKSEKSEKPKPAKKPAPAKSTAGQGGSDHSGSDSH
ncbi:outer membrane porin GjpA [Mycolicibacterium mucogenicum]|uniref:outer membrane porin GjpA n=1 Tax=Mycolicibacterium mucogenicum TaxID=56689 RepID=UPI00226ACAEB|nr:outer membrane porin GjpA [Mycolicibacterium mucogenicum]MCX8563204.1 outer membrane porin GjpA [Mycolicibacterium mucogenicum]